MIPYLEPIHVDMLTGAYHSDVSGMLQIVRKSVHLGIHALRLRQSQQILCAYCIL